MVPLLPPAFCCLSFLSRQWSVVAGSVGKEPPQKSSLLTVTILEDHYSLTIENQEAWLKSFTCAFLANVRRNRRDI